MLEIVETQIFACVIPLSEIFIQQIKWTKLYNYLTALITEKFFQDMK